MINSQNGSYAKGLLFGLLITTILGQVNAHVGAWHNAMWCLKGNKGNDDHNADAVVQPLVDMKKEEWWMRQGQGCHNFPPDDGVFLDLPANGSFTVEIATNRRFTSTIIDPKLGAFPDGNNYTDGLGGKDCITGINMHTQNETMAHGTAFAISYTPNLSNVTEENLVVFSALDHTPWKRIGTYKVPDLPNCPPGGCICTWGWIPNGCGRENMYFQPFRCRVLGGSNRRLATPKIPVWCGDDVKKCVTGAKQMIFWHQTTGNNVADPPNGKTPGYNPKMGFENGAQNDIFEDSSLGSSSSPSSSPSPSPASRLSPIPKRPNSSC